MYEKNLKAKLLIPTILICFALTLVMGALVYNLKLDNLSHIAYDKLKNVGRVLDKTLLQTVDKLDTAIFFLQEDKAIQKLWLAKDRQALYRYTQSLFTTLKETQQITHMYFISLDKKVFLRLHNPRKFDDTIKRKTLEYAQTNLSKSSGLEHGINHNLTLRSVHPWYIDNKLVGYVEMGEEIAHMTHTLANNTGTDIFITLKKDLYDRETWERGNKLYGTNAQWDRLSHRVVIGQTLSFDAKLDKFLNKDVKIGDNALFMLDKEGVNYFGGYIDLQDISEKVVGNIVVLIDVSKYMSTIKKTIFFLIIAFFIFFAILLFFYHRYLHRLENSLEENFETIKFNYDFEKFVNTISKRLLLNENMDEALCEDLKELGEALHAQRAYFFTFNEDFTQMSNTHEWCAPSISVQKDNLQNISTKEFSWWMEKCFKKEPIIIEDIEDLPPSAAIEKESLSAQNIKSLLAYPVYKEKALLGFLGVDMVYKNVVWTQTHHSFIKVSSEIVAVYLSQYNTKEKLKKAHADMSLMLEVAMNGILSFDKNAKLKFYNNAFLKLFNIEDIKKDIGFNACVAYCFEKKLLHVENFHKIIDAIKRSKDTKMYFTLTAYDGRVIEMTVQSQYMDNVFEGRTFSFKDITKRIENENEIRLASKVFENSSDAIIITDEYTNIIRANKSFEKITGYTKEEIIGKKPNVLRSFYHTVSFYENLWETLHEKGIWEGEIWDRKKDGELYCSLASLIALKNIEGKVTNYIGINRDITDLKDAQEKIKDIAYNDQLTGIPNRVTFNQTLDALVEKIDEKFALFFIDLDNFKYVNDANGHHVGDKLLQVVAKKLRYTIKEEDFVFRLGGDEFTVILQNYGSLENIEKIAQKIVEKLSETLVIDGKKIQVGCSIGISLYPDMASDKDTLIRFADTAMYSAKRRGKNGYKIYIA